MNSCFNIDSNILKDATKWIKDAGYIFDDSINPEGSVCRSVNHTLKGDMESSVFELLGMVRACKIKDFRITEVNGSIESHIISFEFTVSKC